MQNNRSRQHKDYVVGLLSGRMVTEFKEGKAVSVFQPQLKNKYPVMGDVFRHGSLTSSEDQIMVAESLRLRPLQLDKCIFIKTESEKLRLKRMKSENKLALIKAGFNPRKRMNVDLPQLLSK